MDVASLHPGTIRSDDPPQFRYRQGWAVFRHQAISAQPPATVAPIAGDIQRGQAVGDLAEGNDAGGHGDSDDSVLLPQCYPDQFSGRWKDGITT